VSFERHFERADRNRLPLKNLEFVFFLPWERKAATVGKNGRSSIKPGVVHENKKHRNCGKKLH
jgi:hypothetical protein